MMETLEYLHYGLSLILIFFGTKMLLSHYWHVPTAAALAVIGVVLLISVLASVIYPKKKRA